MMKPNERDAKAKATRVVRLARIARYGFLLTALVLIGLFFFYRLDRYLTLTSLHESEAYLNTHFSLQERLLLYLLGAITWVTCALPAATIIMLLAGALFGPFAGTLVCVIATSTGAVTSLLLSRFLFRDFVRMKFGRQAAVVEREYARRGSDYLIAMRLIPVVPYFVTNLLFGLTSIRPLRFWLTSMLASLPAIFIYANAGSELAKLTTLSGILTWRLMLALIALAALPFIGRLITSKILRINKID